MKPIARMLLPLLLCLALASAAQAEPVQMFRHDYICRYTAPNGQELYFVSSESDPQVILEDVNFDGVDDIVVLTANGATNAFFEFFVWDGSQYVWAWHWEPDYGLCNYALDPRGYVVCHGHNGMAGALFEDFILAWDGPALTPVRKMVSEEKTEFTFTDELYTVVTYQNALHIQVYDYASGNSWETDATLDDFMRDGFFDDLQSVFWQGL